MNFPLLSAVVVAHNEEKNLDDCLSALSFADEIVVILDKCTDSSRQVAAKYTDRIIEGSWEIEGQRRNVGISNCRGQWILEIDADERVSKELADEILKVIKTSTPCLFTVPIANYVGSRYVRYGWLRYLAVSKRQTLHFRDLKKYHEDKQVHPTADLYGSVEYLQTPLIHLMDHDIADMIARFNRYTSWKANDMLSRGKIKGSVLSNFFSGFNRFIKAFIVNKGYKEKGLGLFIAILAALYPLVAYLKAREKFSFKK